MILQWTRADAPQGECSGVCAGDTPPIRDIYARIPSVVMTVCQKCEMAGTLGTGSSMTRREVIDRGKLLRMPQMLGAA